MQLDVIVPTYNRQNLLARTLESLLVADVPEDLSIFITVVDNNSTDQTAHVVEQYIPRFAGRLKYLFEKRQGRSSALNAGITATTGDLVGMIDDDEEIDRSWFVRVREAFTKSELDFIGGPYIPRWAAPPPPWLLDENSGVIGIVNGGPESYSYGTTDSLLVGGNAVLRRSILQKIGGYCLELGRQGRRPLADEDTDMYQRLLAAGANGLYMPDLIIYHYIHPERLTKKYFRSWHFWRGTSSGVLDRKRPKPVAYLFGIPRHLYGSAGRALFRMLTRLVKIQTDAAQNFADELQLWDLAGFFYGRHFYKPLTD